MKARRALRLTLVLVVVMPPLLALHALCEQVGYDDGGLGGEDWAETPCSRI